MTRVAIILCDALQRVGLQVILEEYFQPVAVSAPALAEGADEADLYFTDSATYLGNIDFFLARRSRVAIIVSQTNCTNSSPSMMIAVEQSREVMLEGIARFFETVDTSRAESPTSDDLSQREVQVLQLVVSGMINKEIAQRLSISQNTVLTHRRNITSKLGIKTVSGLTLYALMHGYITT